MIFGLIILILIAPALALVVKVALVIKALTSAADSVATALSEQGRTVQQRPRRVRRVSKHSSLTNAELAFVAELGPSPTQPVKEAPILPNAFLTATAQETRAVFPRGQRSATELLLSGATTVALVIASLVLWPEVGGLSRTFSLGVSVGSIWVTLRMFLLESEVTVSPGILVHRRRFFRKVVTTYTHFDVQDLAVDAGSMVFVKPRYRIVLRTSEGSVHALAELIPSRVLAEQTAAAIAHSFGLERYKNQFPTPIRQRESQSTAIGAQNDHQIGDQGSGGEYAAVGRPPHDLMPSVTAPVWEGDDIIDGLGRDDTLIGGPGSDTIAGGPGMTSSLAAAVTTPCWVGVAPTSFEVIGVRIR